MGAYSRARPSGHWLDYPDETYGLVGSAEYEKWDQAIDDLKYQIVDTKDYGLTSPSVSSPELLIQQACDDAASYAATAAGNPVIVRVTPGSYTGLDIHLIPGQSGTVIAAAWFWFKDGVWLDLRGCTFKAKAGLTLPGGATRAHLISSDTPYLRPAAGGVIKTNNRIIGGIIDGNANNQTYGAGSTTDGGQSPMLQAGIKLGFCQSFRVEGTKVQNVWGNAQGPTGEAFHIEAWSCKEGWFVGTEIDGSGATNSATGHSASNCQGIRYMGDIAHNLSHGHGFTHYQCAGLTHAGTHAYLCAAGSGYNSELSHSVTYSGAISGGKSLDVSRDGSVAHWAYPSGQVSLSNDKGWTIQGSSHVTLDAACQSTYNTTAGVHVYTNASVSPTVVNDNIFINGIHLHNGSTDTDNFKLERAADGGSAKDQSCVYAIAKLRADFDFYGTTYAGATPATDYFAFNNSGVRFFVHKTYSSLPSVSSFRWIRSNDVGSVPDLSISEIGQVVTRGRRINYVQKSGNYTLTALDEYVGCTGTATTAQTMTLPAASAVGAGTVFTIKDEVGSAATHNVTVARAGSDTIDGATSVVISANYGVCRLVCTGTGWAVI